VIASVGVVSDTRTCLHSEVSVQQLNKYLYWLFFIHFFFSFEFDLPVVYFCVGDHMLNYLYTMNHVHLSEVPWRCIGHVRTSALLRHTLLDVYWTRAKRLPTLLSFGPFLDNPNPRLDLSLFETNTKIENNVCYHFLWGLFSSFYRKNIYIRIAFQMIPLSILSHEHHYLHNNFVFKRLI